MLICLKEWTSIFGLRLLFFFSLSALLFPLFLCRECVCIVIILVHALFHSTLSPIKFFFIREGKFYKSLIQTHPPPPPPPLPRELPPRTSFGIKAGVTDLELNHVGVKMATPNCSRYAEIDDDKFCDISCDPNSDTPSNEELLNAFHELQTT